MSIKTKPTEPIDQYHSEPMPIPSWLIIDAARYACGRQSYQVGVTCDWLCRNWARLPEHARSIIKNDVEEAFRRDDDSRANGHMYHPLGMDCDRASWAAVRRLWQTEGTR